MPTWAWSGGLWRPPPFPKEKKEREKGERAPPLASISASSREIRAGARVSGPSWDLFFSFVGERGGDWIRATIGLTAIRSTLKGTDSVCKGKHIVYGFRDEFRRQRWCSIRSQAARPRHGSLEVQFNLLLLLLLLLLVCRHTHIERQRERSPTVSMCGKSRPGVSPSILQPFRRFLFPLPCAS